MADGPASISTVPTLSYAFAKEQGFVLLAPEAEEGRAPLAVGMREGADPLALIEVRRALGQPLKVDSLTSADFDRVLSRTYAVEGIDSENLTRNLDDDGDFLSLIDDIPETADLLDTDDDAPVIRLINSLIAEAHKRQASDIHVEPYESKLSVRLRMDGVLQEVVTLGARLAPLLVSRIKVMARLDIAEKRIPQDGRISLAIGGKSLDVRVSTLPSRHGERVVMRLLDKDQAHFHMDALGMSAAVLNDFRAALAEPNGIILVTGPTGSGKTTTLYAGLSRLNDESRNILTVEDPVEYALEGIGQTQVNARVGMTFAAGLRAILRQDPDVVMVGEIRDVETAEIAVQASLTGHLVLSTVHTNDAVSAITRLRDMGVEPFLLASTVKAILAQRLVRRLCPDCREPFEADAPEREVLGIKGVGPVTLYRPKGCAACNHTGFAGRVGLYEIIRVDGALRRLIHDDADEQQIADKAFETRETLLTSGRAHALAGRTSLEEVMRVCRREEAAHRSVDHGGL